MVSEWQCWVWTYLKRRQLHWRKVLASIFFQLRYLYSTQHSMANHFGARARRPSYCRLLTSWMCRGHRRKGTIGKLTTLRALTPDFRSMFVFSLVSFPISVSLSQFARSLSPSSAPAIRAVFIHSPLSLLYPAYHRSSVHPFIPQTLPLLVPFRPFLTIAAGSSTYLPTYLPTPRGYEESQIGRESERERERARERGNKSGRLSIIDSDSRAPYCHSTHRRWWLTFKYTDKTVIYPIVVVVIILETLADLNSMYVNHSLIVVDISIRADEDGRLTLLLNNYALANEALGRMRGCKTLATRRKSTGLTGNGCATGRRSSSRKITSSYSSILHPSFFRQTRVSQMRNNLRIDRTTTIYVIFIYHKFFIDF